MHPWEPYRPTADHPWDLAKVGHLYRRAAFGATWAELQRGLADGPEKTIDRLLAGGPSDPDFDRTSDFMASERSLPAGAPGTQLAAWWLARILRTPHPLRERHAPAGRDVQVQVQAILHRLRLGHPLEVDPRAVAVRILECARCIALARAVGR